MLLSGHSAWKRSFYLLALVGFWSALDVRFCFDFFIFAVALAYFDRVRRSQSVSLWPTLVLAVLLVAGFLISADTGLYSLAAFIIAGSAHALLYRSDPLTYGACLRAAALSGLMLAGLVLLTSMLMQHAGFTFWTNSLEVVSQYRWSMAYPMDRPIKWRLITASTVSMLLLLIGYRWKDSLANSLARRPAFFPGAIAFSLLTLQSTIVRPDWGHVSIALLPSLALSGAVLMGSEAGPRWSWRGDLPVLLAFALTAVFSGPAAPLVPKNIAAGLELSEITKSQTCPSGTFYLDEACLPASVYEPLRTVSEFLQKHTALGETVAIFPFENLSGDVARRQVAGGVLQNYQIAGERLTRCQLDGLKRDHPRVAIFWADGLATLGVDGVPNFTRTPTIWLYFQSRFTKRAELAPGIAALLRDETRPARWQQQITPVGNSLRLPIRLKRPIVLPLNHWSAESDFLKLRVLVEYPVWWRLRKPSTILVNVRHTDETTQTLRAVLPPNHWSDLWIYPWDDAQLINYFDARESAWRKARPRSAVTAVQLTFERMDWLSVVPSSINIQSIEAVRLRLD